MFKEWLETKSENCWSLLEALMNQLIQKKIPWLLTWGFYLNVQAFIENKILHLLFIDSLLELTSSAN